MDMELCRRGVVEGKEKQVVASFVQLTEANWTHLDNVSSSIQCLLQKAQILEVRSCRNIRARMSGFDLQLASIASPKMARI